jgi:hypothetical protein
MLLLVSRRRIPYMTSPQFAGDGGTIHGRVDLVAPLRSRLHRTGRDPLELSTCSLEAL